MQRTARATRGVLRLTGAALIILGILFWTGHALDLVNLHTGLGAIFVVALWVQAFAAARTKGVNPLVLVTVAWGVVVLAVGMLQLSWLPGPWHWTIQLLHLLIGLAAMGMGERLGRLAVQPGA